MNLIQADGYNPLVIRGNRFTVSPEHRADVLALVDHPAALETFLAAPFTPGGLLKQVALTGAGLRVSPEDFLDRVLSKARAAV